MRLAMSIMWSGEENDSGLAEGKRRIEYCGQGEPAKLCSSKILHLGSVGRSVG